MSCSQSVSNPRNALPSWLPKSLCSNRCNSSEYLSKSAEQRFNSANLVSGLRDCAMSSALALRQSLLNHANNPPCWITATACASISWEGNWSNWYKVDRPSLKGRNVSIWHIKSRNTASISSSSKRGSRTLISSVGKAPRIDNNSEQNSNPACESSIYEAIPSGKAFLKSFNCA